MLLISRAPGVDFSVNSHSSEMSPSQSSPSESPSQSSPYPSSPSTWAPSTTDSNLIPPSLRFDHLDSPTSALASSPADSVTPNYSHDRQFMPPSLRYSNLESPNTALASSPADSVTPNYLHDRRFMPPSLRYSNLESPNTALASSPADSITPSHPLNHQYMPPQSNRSSHTDSATTYHTSSQGDYLSPTSNQQHVIHTRRSTESILRPAKTDPTMLFPASVRAAGYTGVPDPYSVHSRNPSRESVLASASPMSVPSMR